MRALYGRQDARRYQTAPSKILFIAVDLWQM